MRRSCCLLCVLLCAVARAAEPIAAPEAFAEIRDLVARTVEDQLSPAIGVAVVQGGKLIWLEAFGKADVGRGIAATVDTPFPMASCSKPVTALACAALAEDGTLDLDKAVNAYLGTGAVRAAQGNAELITPRRLMNHTAGLARYFSYYYTPATPAPAAQVLARYAEAVLPPGERFEYSNLGYTVVGAVLEKVTGAPWETAVVERVFAPLGLQHSSATTPEDAAQLYSRDAADRLMPLPAAQSDHAAGSGLWMGLADAAQVLRLVLGEGSVDGKTVLKAETVRQLFDTPKATPQAGMGWFVAEYLGQASFSHGGSMPGAMAELRGFPASQSGVVVFTNADGNNLPGQIIWAISQKLFPGAEEKEPEPQEVRESVLDGFEGDWSATLRHFSGPVALTLLIEDEDTAYLRFGEGPMRRVQGFGVVGDEVSGQLWAEFPAREDFRSTVKIGFDLRKNGDQLTGIFTTEADKLFYLPTYVAFDAVALGDAPAEVDVP